MNSINESTERAFYGIARLVAAENRSRMIRLFPENLAENALPARVNEIVEGRL